MWSMYAITETFWCRVLRRDEAETTETDHPDISSPSSAVPPWFAIGRLPLSRLDEFEVLKFKGDSAALQTVTDDNFGARMQRFARDCVLTRFPRLGMANLCHGLQCFSSEGFSSGNEHSAWGLRLGMHIPVMGHLPTE